MKLHARAILAGALLWAASGTTVRAEPWLANRYAENCAGCHAPGRINRPAADRRCTLNCQACHVNPNGGGLRTFYGNWNSRRWVRSFASDFWLLNKRRPAPYKWQYYNPRRGQANQKNLAVKNTVKSPLEDEEEDDGATSTLGGAAAKKMPKVPPTGFPTVVYDNLDYDERDYDRSDGSEKLLANNDDKFTERVTADDPYREERRTPFSGGGDLRYVFWFPLGAANNNIYPTLQTTRAWLMSIDVGARWRPVPTNLQVVLEGRFMTPPNLNAIDNTLTNEPRPRSAYLLVDDLPYNSYAQAGFYRPMFGLYTPNHDAIVSKLTGLTQRALYKGVGIGASPNVPFFAFNLISGVSSTNPTYDQSSGFVANLGARWVTLGASLMVSYWSTNTPDPTTGEKLNRTMLAVNGGMKYGRFILEGEMLYVKREFAPTLSDAGATYTANLRYRLWREMYLQLHGSFANTSITLKEGSAQEIEAGLRAFLLAGTDLELSYVSRSNTASGTTLKQQGVMLMTHLYF